MKNITLFNSLDRSPIRFFSDLESEFDRIFSPYSALHNAGAKDLANFTPHFDFMDRESHYVVSFDIPGVKSSDVKLEVKDGVLSIQGERKYERREGDYVERSRGHFQRSIKLPQDVEEENVEAHFEDGVLSVALPKAQKAKPKEIAIKEGKKSGVWSRLLGFTQHKEENKEIQNENEKAS